MYFHVTVHCKHVILLCFSDSLNEHFSGAVGFSVSVFHLVETLYCISRIRNGLIMM